MNDPEVSRAITGYTRSWGAYARRLTTGLTGCFTVPYATALLCWNELNGVTRAMQTEGVVNHDTWTWARSLEAMLQHLSNPASFIPDMQGPTSEPGVPGAAALTLHVLSDSLALAGDALNHNPLIAIPATLENIQNTVEIYAEASLPKWLHYSLRTVHDTLAYATPFLAPHLTPLVISSWSSEAYRAIPILPVVLTALWGIGTLTSILDVSRLTARLLVGAQHYYAKHNRDFFTDLCQKFFDSIECDYLDEKRHVNARELQIEALVAAGIDAHLASFASSLDFTTKHMQILALNMQNALSQVPTSSRSKIYPEHRQALKEAIIKAARGLKPQLERAARSEHSLIRPNER